MDELKCYLCGEVMLGRGVLLINEHGEGEVQWKDAPKFPNGVEYLALHPNCFEKIWESVLKIEDHSTVFTFVFGSISDLLGGLTEIPEGG